MDRIVENDFTRIGCLNPGGTVIILHHKVRDCLIKSNPFCLNLKLWVGKHNLNTQWKGRLGNFINTFCIAILNIPAAGKFRIFKEIWKCLIN